MCNRICINLAKTKHQANGSMYAKGFVYCMGLCDCYFDPKDCVRPNTRLLCPCCRGAIRTRPRAKKNMIVVRIG